MEHLMIQLALIGIISLMCQWASWYLKIPSILFLLISGFLIGPVTGMIDPDQLFSNLLFPFISMSVAIILFEGALTLNLDEIKGHGRMVTNLVSVGMLVTWSVVLVASYFILDISFAVACLFAAIVVVTGPTVIVPLIRAAKPNSNIANILRWEGILIDPLGALFAVLVYEFVANQQGTIHTFWLYSKTLIIGISLGLLTAGIVSEGLRKHWFPHYLINTVVMVLMLAVYVISNDLQEESGLLTVTVMGIALANKKDIDVSNIIEFKETLSVLLISSLFILLAARIDIDAFLMLGWEIFGVLLVIMLVARPLSVWISSWGSKELTRQELMFIAWVSPRGIVAAAVSALFAIKLEQGGIKGADMLVPLVFSVIISTVIVQSITSRWLVKWLNVESQRSKHIFIFGANEFARKFALELQSKGMKVTLADPNWENTSAARMDGLEVYYGNPATESSRWRIKFTNYGKVFVLSPYQQLNLLITYFFEDMLGSNRIFSLVSLEEQSRRERYKTSAEIDDLFTGIPYHKLNRAMKQGGQIKITKFTESYTQADFEASLTQAYVPLVKFEKNAYQLLRSAKFDIAAGEELMYLLLPDSVKHEPTW